MASSEDIRKVNVLGQVQKRPITDDWTPDKVELLRPNLSANSLAKFFCIGCGAYGEVNMTMTQNFIEFADLAELSSEQFQGKYLRVNRCLCCDSKFKLDSIENV